MRLCPSRKTLSQQGNSCQECTKEESVLPKKDSGNLFTLKGTTFEEYKRGKKLRKVNGRPSYCKCYVRVRLNNSLLFVFDIIQNKKKIDDYFLKKVLLFSLIL